MSLNKRRKADVAEFADNQICLTSKFCSNKTFSRVRTRKTWEDPIKNIQKEKNLTKNPQVGQSSAGSGKRKSSHKVEPKPAETSSEAGPNATVSCMTKINEPYAQRNHIIAVRRSKRTVDCLSSPTKMSSVSLSETHVRSIRNTCDSTFVEEGTPRRTTGKTCINREIDKKILITPDRNKVNNHIETEKKIKTAAQSRLISKRKQFEIAAKQALITLGIDKNPKLLMEKEKQENVKIIHNPTKKFTSCNSSSSGSDAKPIKTRIRERVRKQLRDFKEKSADMNDVWTSNSVSDDRSLPLEEEMDWEPSEQNDMIEHIKTMRRNFNNVEELSKDIAMCSNTDMETKQDENNLVLVFDTNVFISCLPFIKEILDTCVPGLGLPRIFIPWRILQELDHLKTSDIKPLQVSAIRAIRFLNEKFTSRHPRVCGQSFEEIITTVKDSHSSPDDEILHACVTLKQNYPSRIVILITNDKNLETKAIVSGVESFSKDRFMKSKILPNEKTSRFNVDSKTRNITLKSDMTYCRLKGALKKFLEQLLETEFANAFNKDWKKIVTKKPPWMLMDMLECLIKYWRSVFTFIFKKDVLALVEDLKEHFLKVEKGETTTVADIAQVSKELMTRISYFVTDEKPYSKILRETMNEVEMWVESKKTSNIEKAEVSEVTVQSTAAPSSSHEFPAISNTQSSMLNVALCKEKVKNLFQIIWDQVKAFFCRVSELAAGNGLNNPDAVIEVKTQFPHVIRNLQELIEIVEKILSLGPDDASQANQIILHFTSFLVGLSVFQVDATEMNNLPDYIRLFCDDNEGRLVLCTLVNDLKQFAMGMIGAMKVLERL